MLLKELFEKEIIATNKPDLTYYGAWVSPTDGVINVSNRGNNTHSQEAINILKKSNPKVAAGLTPQTVDDYMFNNGWVRVIHPSRHDTEMTFHGNEKEVANAIKKYYRGLVRQMDQIYIEIHNQNDQVYSYEIPDRDEFKDLMRYINSGEI